MSIDYARAKAKGPALKAALTRAKKQGYAAVLVACQAAIKEWDIWGAWPDDWSTWSDALGDAACKQARETGVWPYPRQLTQL